MNRYRFSSALSALLAALILLPGIALAKDPLMPRPSQEIRKAPVDVPFDAASVKVAKRAKIPYQEITLGEIQQKTGDPRIQPDTPILLPPEYSGSGKVMLIRADEALRKVNDLEKQFNEDGYSFREVAEEVSFMETVVDKSRIETQKQRLMSLRKPGDPSRVLFGSRPGKALRQELDRTRSARAATLKNAVKKFTPTPMEQPGQPQSGGPGQLMSLPAPKTSRYNVLSKNWSPPAILEFGDRSSFATSLQVQYSAEGNPNSLKVSPSASAVVTIFKKDFEVVKVTGSATAPSGSGAETSGGAVANQASITVYVAGQQLFPVSIGPTQEPILFEPSARIGVGYGVKTRFAIGPIPISLSAGLQGEAGVSVNLVAEPSIVQVVVTPYIDTKAYAECAIDLVLVAAGVGGQLRLLYLDLEMGARLELYAADGGEPAYVYKVYASSDLEALSGEMYAFVKVWYLFGSKKYKWTFAKWDGYQLTSDLFREEGQTPFIMKMKMQGLPRLPEYQDKVPTKKRLY